MVGHHKLELLSKPIVALSKNNATSLQQPPMGQHKSGFCREVTAMERPNIVKQYFGNNENWLL